MSVSMELSHDTVQYIISTQLASITILSGPLMVNYFARSY